MPETRFFDELDQYFTPYNVKRISSKKLGEYNNKYVAGWEIPTKQAHKGKNLSLRVLYRCESKYVTPDVLVYPDVLGVLEFPHVETNSYLCVWDSNVCPDYDIYGYLADLISEADVLLREILAGHHRGDFKSGFLSYWDRYVTSNVKGISLCNPKRTHSRVVYLYSSRRYGLVFGDDYDQVSNWVMNVENYPKSTDKLTKAQKRDLSRISKSALFCFDDAWMPSGYPKTILELKNQVVPKSLSESEFAELIGEALNNKQHRQIAMLASFQTPNGVCYAGLSPKTGLFSEKSRYSHKSPMSGFRYTISARDILLRTLKIKLTGFSVERHDPSWVYGRDQNVNLQNIQSTKIAIIGCGSVGSSIAKLLAKSGIHSLILVDGDSLESANTGRHELGAKNLKENKANALKHNLQINFPLTSIEAISANLQPAMYVSGKETFISKLEGADLIVSATADWSSDRVLLHLQETYDLAPIVFVLTEPRAAAGHIITHIDGSGAYQATFHMDGVLSGNLKTPCTEWDADTRIKLPTCGGTFQPYAATSLSHVHAVATERILDIITSTVEPSPALTSWLCQTKYLQGEGGSWNSGWIKKYGDPVNGYKIVNFLLQDEEWVIE